MGECINIMVIITPIKKHDSTKEAKLLNLQQHFIC